MADEAVIRAAITEWDRESHKGQGAGEFVYLLSERERAELAERIAARLEAEHDARRMGPLLSAAELEHLRNLAAVASRPLRDALRHIDAQAAIILELVGEVRSALHVTSEGVVMGNGELAGNVRLIAEIIGETAREAGLIE